MNDDYYQQNAQRFYDDTVNVNMSVLYEPFLAHLKPGAQILDAGCGSGRDTRAFSDLGFEVEAFDASAELVERARQLTSRQIEVMRFQEMTAVEKYDGIWCCASLLHVPETELPEVMALLARALKPGGVWYLSFKYGRGEREKDGRVFTDMDEAALQGLAAGSGIKVDLIDIWKTEDLRAGRDSEIWLNILLARRA
ncbi:class I SAM-dependent methyltransferase [Erwinia sp. MMLR14_017]|uniref:class I SAM-dependent methyltransferase n=1 Tax=Erwinia sp. MMLR14_017 TaxID=3093842 RepID=UPI00298F8A8A|nr:class I SAM-dependent methyltransferase [Erwinia sp. MMLR14_017]MDW8845386.1 class I SAM-dependent methyltransferase [Erwinia sp. MMLR14_017]